MLHVEYVLQVTSNVNIIDESRWCNAERLSLMPGTDKRFCVGDQRDLCGW